MLDANVFSRYKSVQDFSREREEFEARKRAAALQEQLGQLQMQGMQQKLNTPEQLTPEQILAKAIQGGAENLTPQEQAQLKAYDVLQRTKQSVDPRGNIITNRSIYDMLPGEVNQMPPRQAMQMPTRLAPISAPPPQMPLEQIGVDGNLGVSLEPPAPILPGMNPVAPPLPAPQWQAPPQPAPITVNPADYGVRSPYAREDIAKEAAKADIQAKIEQAKEMRKTGKAQSVISATLDELQNLNDQLKLKGALVSGDKNALQNLQARLGSTEFGQKLASVQDVDVQTLRNQYNLARNSLIPFYVDYFQLPATMVDTEEMATRIIQAFGDPTLDYESNKTAIDRMRGQFGINTPKTAPASVIDNLLNKYAPRQ